MLQPLPVSNDVTDKIVERFAYTYGNTYDSYLINDGNRQIFFSPSRDGLLGYIQHGRYIHVIGGLLAADTSAKKTLIHHFLEYLAKQKIKTILFHNLLEDDLASFEGLSIEATKCGEEAIVNLQETTWSGKPYEWVRRQENYCRRQALRAEEVVPDQITGGLDSQIIKEIQLISERHVKRTVAGKEFTYFAGRLNLAAMKRQRLFIARSADQIEAFILCNPGKNGQFYAIEMYRYREDAPRGTMPFLWMHALREFQSEGIPNVSLCMMPFYNCHEKHPLDNAFLRRSNDFWYQHLNWLFNAKGLQHFKSRFRPVGRPMYTVAHPSTSIGSLRSAFKLWELSSALSPGLIAKRLITSSTQRR